MAELDLDLPASNTNGKSQSETSRSETSRSGTPEESATELLEEVQLNVEKLRELSGLPPCDRYAVEPERAGVLGELAGVMMRAAWDNDELISHLGAHLYDVATVHSMNDHEWGCCDQCGHGDTPWPCSDYLSALRLGLSWLYRRANLEQFVGRWG